MSLLSSAQSHASAKVARTVALRALELVVIVVLHLDFFIVAPWIGCRRLNELLPRELALAPPGSGCYNNEHGTISFSPHGTVAQEPWHFALHAVPLLMLWAWLVWAYFGYPQFWKRPNRGSDGAA